jgi:membrane dipeptidase
MFILDAHLDLAMNAMDWNRDLRLPISEIRRREKNMIDKPDRGNSTVCFPEMRRGNIGLCVATLIARYVREDNPLPGWQSPAQAWAHTQGQLAWYNEMEREGELKRIEDRESLKMHLQQWETKGHTPKAIGYVLSLEGADSIIEPALLERSYAQGLRIVGPAHYGPGTYARGTHSPGGLGDRGRELLRTMGDLGMILDATHLSDESFWEALDVFNGPVWASHSNCRSLIPDQRQFSDAQIKALIERDAVIGVAMDAWMLVPGWIRGQSHPSTTEVGLRHLIQQIDHICQLAGNAHHCGLGTDLDGGFGKEQCPSDLETIADLQKIGPMLESLGYSKAEVAGILHENFTNFLLRALP